jgi:hypothetical protein
MNNEIFEILKPETELEESIMMHSEFSDGALYGKPRRGHPEGKVLYHIREVLDNVDKYSDETNRRDLRLIALIHDTFKYMVNSNLPKTGENHHGMIARRFAEKFKLDEYLLYVIETHDEAYNAFRKLDVKRAMRLIAQLRKLRCEALYVEFFRCDTETGDKANDSFNWFLEIINQNS